MQGNANNPYRAPESPDNRIALEHANSRWWTRSSVKPWRRALGGFLASVAGISGFAAYFVLRTWIKLLLWDDAAPDFRRPVTVAVVSLVVMFASGWAASRLLFPPYRRKTRR